MQDQKEITVPVWEKYMLTIKEAAAYFNIGVKCMRRLAESNEGEFAFIMGNKYLICRPRFERYLDGLMLRKDDEIKRTEGC